MEFSDDDIEEFQLLWKEEFSEEIDVATARSRAQHLMELFLLLAEKRGDGHGEKKR